MIDENIYSIGGMSRLGVMNEFISINIRDKSYEHCEVKDGGNLVRPVECSAITGVFYNARYSEPFSL